MSGENERPTREAAQRGQDQRRTNQLIDTLATARRQPPSLQQAGDNSATRSDAVEDPPTVQPATPLPSHAGRTKSSPEEPASVSTVASLSHIDLSGMIKLAIRNQPAPTEVDNVASAGSPPAGDNVAAASPRSITVDDLELAIATKNLVIASQDEIIAAKVEAIAAKVEAIAAKDKELAAMAKEIAAKDEMIRAQKELISLYERTFVLKK